MTCCLSGHHLSGPDARGEVRPRPGEELQTEHEAGARALPREEVLESAETLLSPDLHTTGSQQASCYEVVL